MPRSASSNPSTTGARRGGTRRSRRWRRPPRQGGEGGKKKKRSRGLLAHSSERLNESITFGNVAWFPVVLQVSSLRLLSLAELLFFRPGRGSTWPGASTRRASSRTPWPLRTISGPGQNRSRYSRERARRSSDQKGQGVSLEFSRTS